MKLGEHKVTSANKDTAYVATVILFNNIALMAHKKIGGWKLVQSCTSGDIKATEYTNGKMFVKAVSLGDEHTYTFGGK